MANDVPRRLIVQDPDFHPDCVVRVANTGTIPTVEQAGRFATQPDPAATIRGDLRPTVSGVPETDGTAGDIMVTKSGVDGRARWGWIRDEDDPATDLQLRQSPMVMGRRVDVIDRNTSATGSPYFIRPKLLALRSGRLLCTWIRGTAVPANLTTAGTVYRAFLTDEDGIPGHWDLDLDVEILVDNHNANNLVGWDMVQYPDTDELVGVAVEYLSGVPPTRYLYVYTSQDDGVTWQERSRQFFEGLPADISLVSGAFSDTTELQHCALEVTQSGRLVCLITTKSALWSLVSDDRGMSWTPTLMWRWTVASAYHGASGVVWGAGCSLAKTRQGMLWAMCGHPHTATWYSVFGMISADGVTWGAYIDHGYFGSNGSPGTLDPCIVAKPDGWPMFYSTVHNLHASGTFHDSIMARACAKRDPNITDDQGDLFPFPPGDYEVVDMHIPENSPAGELYLSGTVRWHGFCGIDAVVWRGQVMILATHNRESAANTFAEGSAMLFHTSHWQPLQECLIDVDDAPRFPALGHVYNRTWDCYGLPSNYGYTLVSTGGSSTIITVNAGSTTGGSLQLDAGAGVSRYYRDTTLPAPQATLWGVVRAFVRVPASGGGSLTADLIGIRLRLCNGVNSTQFTVRLQRSGVTVSIGWYDVLGAAVGAGSISYSMATDEDWIEILCGVGDVTPSFYLFTRRHDPDNDADFDCPYDEVANGAALTSSPYGGVLLDQLEWGILGAGSSAQQCQFKSVQLHRPPVVPTVANDPLKQQPSTFVDEDSASVFSTTGEPWLLSDAGVREFMRTSQLTSIPDQTFEGGLSASFRGEATSRTSLGYGVDYTYAGKYLFDLSSRQVEWRSVSNTAAIEIVLDATRAGARPGATFRPEAFAVLGRNWCTMRLQFNNADTWGAPSWNVGYSIPGVGSSGLRNTHLLSINNVGGYGVAVGQYRARIFVPNGRTDVLRPHRFASKEGGPRFYAVFPDNPESGTDKVFRIVDNDDNTLFFHSDPIANGITTTAKMVIYSDRFAVEFDHYNPAATEQGYRYCRLLIEACTMVDDDELFMRTGLVVLGRATPLDPGIAYGYSVSHESGSTLSLEERGIAHRARNHSPRMVWSLDAPVLASAAEAESVHQTPTQQGRSWQKFVDLTRRLEANGEPAVLVFDGARFLGEFGELSEQVAADPLDLTMVRVQSIGEIGHIGYGSATLNTPPIDAECWPRPVAQVRRIVLEEDL